MGCLVCGAPCPVKAPGVPGPQPKYCGRTCQTKASHAANVARRRSNAAEVVRLRARVAELEAELAAIGHVDWARVPASALIAPCPNCCEAPCSCAARAGAPQPVRFRA